MNSLATTLAAVTLALTLPFASPEAPVAQEDGACVSARQAQAAVENGSILDLPRAAQREGVAEKYISDEARLCDVDGAPHWVVIVQNAYGDSERVVLNAQAD